MNSDISPHIEENEAYIRNRLKNCDDFIIRPMVLGEEKKIHCMVVYIEVAVSNMVLEDSVIGKLVNHMWEMPADEILEFVRDNGMGISDVQAHGLHWNRHLLPCWQGMPYFSWMDIPEQSRFQAKDIPISVYQKLPEKRCCVAPKKDLQMR